MSVDALAAAAYIVAALLFILSLAGLSRHESARAGVIYGIVGMAIALGATLALTIADAWGTPGATLGLSLLLAALTVHFRDIKDILSNLLTLWFFATPIIYPMHRAPGTISKAVLNANPVSHFAVSYQEILFYDGPFGHWKWLMGIFGASLILFLAGYFVFDRLRDSFAEEV